MKEGESKLGARVTTRENGDADVTHVLPRTELQHPNFGMRFVLLAPCAGAEATKQMRALIMTLKSYGVSEPPATYRGA